MGLSARQAHAILASALSRPEVLENWRCVCPDSRGQSTGVDEVDIGALRRFVGLMTKVRHNDLRKYFPFAFKILDLSDIDIELFAAYAAQGSRLSRPGSRSTAAKQEALYAFLERELVHDHPVHSLVWDMVRHERILGQLREEFSIASPAGSRGCLITRRSLAICTVPLCEMTCNPVAVGRQLRRGLRDLRELERGRFRIAYRRATVPSHVEVLELDELSFTFLRLADGRRSAAEISEAIVHAGAGSLAALEGHVALQELANRGLIAIHHADGG